MTHIWNSNEIHYDAGDFVCDCEHPVETSMPPAYCLNCNRYIDPSRLTANGDGSYSLKPTQLLDHHEEIE